MNDRLPPISGEWINRDRPVSFTFEGMPCTGFAGDTITSALWASGQRILGRSFKYHRPRGILSFANHDVNAVVQSGSLLNLRADITPINDGMEVKAVNTWGDLLSDRASILDKFSQFLPVGFYYKAFHERQWFPLWERLIRQITGLGVLDFNTPRPVIPDYYDFCDVLVIGGGTSGVMAALTAASAGARVSLVDENPHLGGTGCYQIGGITQQVQRVRELVESAIKHPYIRIFTNTQAAGYYADRYVPLVAPDRFLKMRAKTVIVASGAYEQPAVFHNNDLPGVMFGSAAQRLIYRYAVRPARRVVILAANVDGYRVALDLLAHGVEVLAIADLRAIIPDSEIVNQVRERNIRIFPHHCIYEARTNPATYSVGKAILCPLGEDDKPQTSDRFAIDCDGIVMSVGWAGATNLLYQAGAKMRFDSHLQQFVPERLPEGVFACGRANGVFSHTAKLQDGERAGLAAVAYLGLKESNIDPLPPELESPSHPYPFVEHPQGKNFVDFDEDLQLKDFKHAVQEGFDNIELLKRYTTVGMSPSQGKHSNLSAIRLLAKLTGKPIKQVGSTTARPFFHPLPMAHLAGHHFIPERQTPLHQQHIKLDAEFMRVGAWQRPAYYRRAGKNRQECIESEALAVRQGLGIIDVGTLGKIEIFGADAATFLERIYTGRFANMKIGTTRYALMLDEAGTIIDDGVVARLGAEQFYFTTTTSNAATIYRELCRWNVIWQLDCGIVNLTGARAAMNIAGLLSQQIVAQLTDIDLQTFPYLGVRIGTVAGVEAVLMRVGFVGEWGYEIHVPADAAATVWETLMEIGKPLGISPFGVEAQRLLRLEKGHIIVGQDTDGLTSPLAANLNWTVKSDKSFFIGQRSLQILSQQPQKQKLVGFHLKENYQGAPPQENLLIIANNEIAGRTTSVSFSPPLKRYIGLAYLSPDLATPEREFTIRAVDGSAIAATVTTTPFYDPENIRQKETAPLVKTSARSDFPKVRTSAILRSLELSTPSHFWQVINHMPTLMTAPNDATYEASVGIADLSCSLTWGVKGKQAAQWLSTQGLLIPAHPNRWEQLSDGGLIARLGQSEFLIADSPISEGWAKDLPAQVYPVRRQDTAIALGGKLALSLLQQVCAFNFAELDLATRPVVMTMMAGITVTVAPVGRVDRGEQLHYRLWCDYTYGAYLWHTLAAIAHSLGGGVIGTQRFLNH